MKVVQKCSACQKEFETTYPDGFRTWCSVWCEAGDPPVECPDCKGFGSVDSGLDGRNHCLRCDGIGVLTE